MLAHFLKITYRFSVYKLIKQKQAFKHKICYKEKLSFLQSKQTPVSAIITRLMRCGFFLKLLRTIMQFFVKSFFKYLKTLPANNDLKGYFVYNYSLRDLNRILFWKLSSVNSLFNIKKIKKKQFIYYLKTTRRISTVLLWFKQIIKMKQSTHKNNQPKLFQPLLPLLTTNERDSQLQKIKLKIYKARLIKGFD